MSNEYPKTIVENKRYRAKIKLRCEQANAKKRNEARAFYFQRCKEDILFFFNVFLWTYDPRKEGVKCHLPFITYDFQDDYILGLEKAYRNGLDHVTEKSRDMGASWMVLGWMFHHWLFDDSFQGLVGSRKEDLVDNSGQLDSLFGKFDYMIDRLPAWMVGEAYFEEKKRYRSHMKLINPRNKNAILGESANRDFSRQGRYSAIALDEFAFWDHGSAVWKATGDSSKTRIAISTSNGMGNKYYEIIRGIEKGELNIPKARLHWKLHPNKDQAWYDRERARRSPIEMAQEIDISYESSVKGRVYDNFSREINVIPVEYDPNLPLYVSWDFGIGDETAIIWLQKDFETNHVFVIDCYQLAGKEIGYFIPFITGSIQSGIYRYTQEERDLIQRHGAWGPAKHFGDPTGGNRQQVTGRSVIETLADEGIYVQTSYKHFKITARYHQTYKLIPRLYVAPRCEEFIDAILNARWNFPEDEFKATPETLKPVHDWTCLHGDTPIRTLNGWVAIRELEGKQFYVWAYSHEEGRLVPTKASKCWKSGENADLVEVTLDNGESIKCTPEHRFMLRDGSYCEARNLRKGYSLMPFYEFNNRGYRRIHLNDGSQADEHRYVFHRLKEIQPKGYHIDHIDEDKNNNNPENLQLLTQTEHCKKTQSWDKNKEERSKKRVRTITKKAYFKECQVCKKEVLMSYMQLYCSKECKRHRDQKARNEQKLLEATWKPCQICDERFLGFKREKNCSKECANEAKRVASLLYNREKRAQAFQNHKVMEVKRITEKAEVWDIEVPKYHNFVANGVVVHNSHFRTSLEFFAVNEPHKQWKTGKAQREKEIRNMSPKYRRGAMWNRPPAHQKSP